MSNYRCPHCGGLLALPEPQQEYHTRLLPDARLESFDFSAPQHYGRMDHATALPVASVAPGERHERREYHKWELTDVRTHMGLAGATGLCLGLASLATWGAFQLSWVWPFAVMFDAIAVVWLVFVYRAFDDDKAVSHYEEHERYPDPMPMPQQPAHKPIQVEGTFHTQQGHVKRTSILELSCDPQCWIAFCRDVDGGHCNFSGRAAQDHGLTPDEWTEAITAFHMHKWLASLGNDRVAPVLNRAGRWVVRQFATS